ncbi:hypothetical protein F5890DRAFT_718348 [Lentinula detonsa]|uniref:Uncharacterized protein n=1 Tax=Lentinula detonsa TaxID=2804962 RepID=A0AA38Q578_9AGAR|nr:hypothetical protein F5890DRAFT_718348 [Lentinula detonsa]
MYVLISFRLSSVLLTCFNLLDLLTSILIFTFSQNFLYVRSTGIAKMIHVPHMCGTYTQSFQPYTPYLTDCITPIDGVKKIHLLRCFIHSSTRISFITHLFLSFPFSLFHFFPRF